MKSLNGWIIYNGYLQTPKFLEMVELYRVAAIKRGIDVKPVRNDELLIVFQDNNAVIKGKYRDCSPDFVIFMDKDVRLARHLEKLGMKLFNSSTAIEICDDKTMTYQVLANRGIRLPKTIIAPLVYQGCEEGGFEYYEYIEDELKYPIVVKEAFGSFGEQVYLAANRGELVRIRRALIHKPHIYQEFIESSRGRDVRIHVVGDQAIAAMMRTSDRDFRTNLTGGGRMNQYVPSAEFIDMAVKCTKLVGAGFAGVDILFGPHQEPILCEVNSNAHIKNIFNITGIDVADRIVEYIIGETGK